MSLLLMGAGNATDASGVTGGASPATVVSSNRGSTSIGDSAGAFSGFHHDEFNPAATIAVDDYILCMAAEEDYNAGSNRAFANGSTGGADPWATLLGPSFFDDAGGWPINAILLGKKAKAADVTAAFATWTNPPVVNYGATIGSTVYGSIYSVIIIRGANTTSPISSAAIQHNSGAGDIIFPTTATTFLNQLLLNMGIIKDTSGLTSVTFPGSQTIIHSPGLGGFSMETASAYEPFATPTAGINRTIAMAGTTKPPHNAALTLAIRS